MSQITTYADGAPGAVLTVTGNIGGAITPDAAGDLGLTGAGVVTITGAPLTNSLEVTVSGAVSSQFDTDAGSAVPALGVLDVLGGTNIATSGTGSTITVNFDGTLPVANGGTGTTTLTDHGVLLGSGTGAITQLGSATNGQLVIGSTGADPVLATLTAGTGMSIVNAAGSITINGPTVTTTFADDVFRVYDNTDNTKKLAFQVSGVTTATTRIITMDDRDINLDAVPDQFATDSGTATPAAGIGTFTGGTNIATSGAGSVVTIDFDGVLPIANGGTNTAGMTNTFGVNYFDGSLLATTAVGTATHVLTSNGTGAAPTFQATTVGTVTSVSGGTNITDSGTATDPILNLDAAITLTTVNATTFDTNVAVAGVTLAGTSLLADGTDTNININITAKGTGQVIIDDLQLTTDLVVTEGGTGVSSLTDHGVLLGSGTSAISVTAVGATNQVLLGNTSADPTWGAVDLTTDITGTLPVANGGTGAITFNTNGINYFDGTNITSTAVGTATQVLTSNGTGIAPTFQAIPSNGLSWVEVTGTTQAMAIDTGYITENSALVTCTLPDTAAVGSVVRITGIAAGGWKIAQNAGETIYFGSSNTTTGTGGYLASTATRDSVELVCVVADTTWNLISSIGNITIV